MFTDVLEDSDHQEPLANTALEQFEYTEPEKEVVSFKTMCFRALLNHGTILLS